MKLRISAIGRMKAGPERDLFEDYVGRARMLGRKSGLSAIQTAEAPESTEADMKTRIAKEADALHALYPAGAFTIVLDATGKLLTSEEFSALLRTHLDRGTSHMAMLIGGPDGHAPRTLAEAGLVVALGRMTWPHRLVRIMLAEQIYRALTIMANHPYHRA
jgi:23S rRNA (pseudouridine1915-N3)-methyltransferase